MQNLTQRLTWGGRRGKKTCGIECTTCGNKRTLFSPQGAFTPAKVRLLFQVSRSVFRCLHIPGLRCFHQGGSGATNGCGRGGERRNHERHRKPRNHEWTRMDTNGYGQGGGTTKDAGSQGTTNGHEWTRKKLRNHEWTRMDTSKATREIRKNTAAAVSMSKSFGDISESAKSGGAGRRSCQEVSQDNDDIRHAHPGDEGGNVRAICEGSVCLRCLR